MRSGNGRHRRPRQAPAIIVAAGVTGAGLAIPLFGATGAQAAQTATWDHVAECESGGMWSANEGNGFYGGLQLTLDMWKKYGGTEYAPRPDLASRSQQISVAEAILGDRGPDAWPSCALGAGLTDGGGAPDVDPGSTADSDPGAGRDGDDSGDRGRDGSSSDADRSGASDKADEADKPDAPDESDASGSAEGPDAPHTSKSPDGLDGSASDGPASGDPDSGSPSDPDGPSASGGSKSPSADPSADPAPSGRHRGSPGAGERAGDGDAGSARPSGRHASRGASDRDEGSTDSTADDYTVRPGDSLSGIAEHQNVSRGWEGLYETNEDLIGIDPDLIIPGQRLDLTIREQ